MMQGCELEKEEFARGMNDKLKKHLREKQDKLSKAEDKFSDL